jgi:hypothetical protein
MRKKVRRLPEGNRRSGVSQPPVSGLGQALWRLTGNDRHVVTDLGGTTSGTAGRYALDGRADQPDAGLRAAARL